jgi:hypothetical protein
VVIEMETAAPIRNSVNTNRGEGIYACQLDNSKPAKIISG